MFTNCILNSTIIAKTKVGFIKIQRGTGVPYPLPLKNHKNIGFLSNTGLDPLKTQKATKKQSVYNVGPSSAHQRDAI